MEKRLLFALVLSVLIMLGWSAIVARIAPQKPPVAISPTENVASPVLQPPVSPAVSLPAAAELENAPKVAVALPLVEAKMIEESAAIQEVIFKKYQDYQFFLGQALALQDLESKFKQRPGDLPEQSVFVYRDDKQEITKKFLFNKSNYSIDLEILIHNLSTSRVTFKPQLVVGVLDFAGDPNEARFKDVTIAQSGKSLHNSGRGNASFEEIQFMALRDRYFCAVVQPLSGKYNGVVTKLSNQKSIVSLNSQGEVVLPNQTISQKFRIYLGPLDLKQINLVSPSFALVQYYGFFDPISHILLQLLGFFAHVTHNWGWAIILLSVVISLLLYPLSIKQMRSMKEMQALQPRIEALRNEYKNNPQRLNKEIMELYKAHKVNPFSGCLPLVLQIPVFFALYQSLIRSIELKGAHFLWIQDLSKPDHLFALPSNLPVKEINLLPILMTVLMAVQQKISMAKVTGAASEQQKMMSILMPGVFLLIFYNMPSGLVLYWLINSAVMLGNQFQINKAT
jgi:YidC/Oxa1 family membrane protein insertase